MVTETVTKSLAGADVNVQQVQKLMANILALLRRRGVPTDSTGIIGLTTHVANFISRSRQGVKVDYPTGFENQIPKEDMEIAMEVAEMVTEASGYEIPRPETVLIASHIAAMRLRCQG